MLIWPAAICDAYQKVLPKRKEKLLEEESMQEKKSPPICLKDREYNTYFE